MASRMIIGLAVGMVNFIIPLYLSEISPQKYAECWFLFSACNYRRNFILLPHQPRFANAEYNWRWMLGAGLVPAVILLVGIAFLGDTPRWLISKTGKTRQKTFSKN